MDVDPTVSRREIGTPTQLSLGTGGYKTLYANLREPSDSLRFKL